jgi:hydrogenase maturation protein HypF
LHAKLIIVKGLVQGIGFRPFVYRTAKRLGLSGWVENRSNSVCIKLQGRQAAIDDFIKTLLSEAPDLVKIESYEILDSELEPGLHDFLIQASQNLSQEVTEISPDLAVCDACLKDMLSQPHRLNYPFINCTYCGPRFSIIQDLPYDRAKTTMAEFNMCATCLKEYEDIEDRRFHAQPIACMHCGPQYEMFWNKTHCTDLPEIIQNTARLLGQGKVIAIKGIGGFHLMCNALNGQAVQTLRKRKHRDDKPFAVMFANIEVVKKYATLSPCEQETLLSRARPIVLLRTQARVPIEINHGLNTLGVMLPYMPIHYQIFEATGLEVLVFTSGNIADEPIVKDNAKALETFSDLADAVVVHNRQIYNRVDDSVVRIVADQPLLMRRSRGYAPEPIPLSFAVDGILALGAELKNCFSLGKGRTAIMSQHIGDLKTSESYLFFSETLERFKHLFRVEPELVVCDLHPDYLSTHYALETGLPLIQTQHHHSHIAACLAEHRIEHEVIGVSFDGTGLGDDETIWGAEFLICDLKKYQRVAHFQQVPLPGGDKAALEPWRMALAYLYQIHGEDCLQLELPFQSLIDPEKQKFIVTMLSKKINLVQTTSAGRLFDAVAALLGLCVFNSFEAEAALKLEASLDESITNRYDYTPGKSIQTLGIIQGILKDLNLKKPVPEIAAKFHNTLIDIIVETAKRIRREFGLKAVALSGGSFQNAYLFKHALNLLQKDQFKVFWNQKVPCNDGGVALGQLAIAAQRRT